MMSLGSFVSCLFKAEEGQGAASVPHYVFSFLKRCRPFFRLWLLWLSFGVGEAARASLVAPLDNGSGERWYLTGDYFAMSPSMPLAELSTWRGRLRPGREVYAYGHRYLGYQWHRDGQGVFQGGTGSIDMFDFSWVQRRDVWARYTSDVSELYHELQMGTLKNTVADYSLFFDGYDLSTEGIRAGVGWYFNKGVKVFLAGSLLKVNDFDHVSFLGHAETLTESQARLQLPFTVRHQYSGCLLRGSYCQFNGRESSLGLGYALDLKVELQQERLGLSMALNDAYSRVRWRSLALTRGRFASLAPPFSDAVDFQAHSVRLPVRGELKLKYRLIKGWFGLMQHRYLEGSSKGLQPFVGAEYTEHGGGFYLLYSPGSKQAGLGWFGRLGEISVLVNNLKPDQGRSGALRVTASHRF